LRTKEEVLFAHPTTTTMRSSYRARAILSLSLFSFLSVFFFYPLLL
jgi:hypothetical protein